MWLNFMCFEDTGVQMNVSLFGLLAFHTLIFFFSPTILRHRSVQLRIAMTRPSAKKQKGIQGTEPGRWEMREDQGADHISQVMFFYWLLMSKPTRWFEKYLHCSNYSLYSSNEETCCSGDSQQPRKTDPTLRQENTQHQPQMQPSMHMCCSLCMNIQCICTVSHRPTHLCAWHYFLHQGFRTTLTQDSSYIRYLHII